MLKRIILVIAVLTLSLLSVFRTSAEACTCGGTWSGLQPCGAYWSSAAVFTGKVTDISIISQDFGNGIIGNRGKVIHFSVEQSFRGVQGADVELLTGMGGGDCGYDFKKDERYFVYAYRDPNNGKLGALRKQSAQDVVVTEGRCAAAEFLTTSLGAIKGKLVNSEGEPASKVKILLIPADTGGNEEKWRGREVLTYTDERCLYNFNQAPPGEYVIVVNYEGQPGIYDSRFPRTYHPGTRECGSW